jgi:methyl-accepting chemotaxis protein
MSWLLNLRLKSKLLISFGFCSLVTIGVAALGQSGNATIYGQLHAITSNNLISVQRSDLVKANVIATNRDFFKAIGLTAVKASPADLDAVKQSLRENQAQAEAEFKSYKAMPLEPDEVAAVNDFERDWPVYIGALDKALSQLQGGDLEALGKLIETSVTPNYRKVIGEVKLMIESNARQAKDLAQAAEVTYRQVTWVLIVGCLMAIVLGLIVTRMITRPIYQSVESAARVAQGDLTQVIVVRGKDETGQLLQALADMQGSLKSTVQQIAEASHQVASAAEELNAVTEESTRGLVRQHDEIQQAATAVNEMTAAVEEVARNAASTSTISTSTAEDAHSGQRQVQQAVVAIDTVTTEINASTQRVEALAGQIHDITKVLDVIRGIAQQTSLLALNAAIEAASRGVASPWWRTRCAPWPIAPRRPRARSRR